MQDILYFGFTFEKFDILDFTDDFLSGVRANYFNSSFEPQSNRCVQYLGDNEYFFIYNMVKGKPLSWKISKNGEVTQKAESVDGNTYRVNCYNKSGRIFKRVYFDLEHNWLKTEYFDKDSAYPEYVLSPSFIDDKPVILKEHNAPDAKVESYLYPKHEMPDDGDYSALAFCDTGFVYFNTVPNDVFISKTVIKDSSVSNLGGFNFDSVDFNLTRNLNTTFDITTAEYLTEENGDPIHIDTNEPFNQVQETEVPVSELEPEVELFNEDASVPDKVIESAGEGYRYYGSIVDGKREGNGRTVTPEGITAYEGGYRLDKRHGFGVFYYKDGRINYVGDWKENFRNGFGVGFRGSDGSAHIGKWDKNSPGGIGARFDEDGNFIFLGTYRDGKKESKGITLDDDGSFVVSIFEGDNVVASYRIDDLLDSLPE